MLKKALVGLVAAAAVVIPAGSASATPGGTCNGTVDYNCRYCSYQGGNAGYPPQYCSSYPQWYRWESCGAWALNACYVG